MPPAGTPMPPATSAIPRSWNRSGPSSRRVTWSRSSIFSRRSPQERTRGALLRRRLKPLSPGHWACPPRRGLHARGIRRTRDLVQTPVLQTNRAELSAPDATRVEGEEVGCNAQAERRPVAAYQGVIGASPAGHLEPWKVARRGFGRLAFGVELHDPVGRAEAQAGHPGDHDAQPVAPPRPVGPAVQAPPLTVPDKLPAPVAQPIGTGF